MRSVLTSLLSALCLLALPCRGALTVINRETFQGIGTLNNSSPGVFSAFTNGAWQKRAVGPRLATAPAPGWSADAQAVDTDSYFDLTTTPYAPAQSGGMIGCWVRFVDFNGAGFYNAPNIANPAMILSLARSDGYQYQLVGITSSGHLVGTTAGGYYIDGGAISANTWYWVQISWLASGGKYTLVASYQSLGGSPVVIGTNTDASAPTKAHALDQPYTYPAPNVYQDYHWRGRIGNVTLCSLTALSDAAIPSDDLAPPSGPFDWYVNPATGSDSNTGTTAATAWASVGKFNAESANAGLFGANTYQGGDNVYFDTSVAPLDPGIAQVLPRTPNSTLRPAAGQAVWTLKPWKNISAPATTWTQYDAANYPNVWMTTDGGATDLGDGTYGNTCVWENDTWLRHPNGTTVADVTAALSSTPGSFWASPSAIYLHPTGNTNPNSDGKVYTRSRNRGGNGGNGAGSGASLVYVGNTPLQIIGLATSKTCLVQANTGDPYNGYGIQLDGLTPAGSTSRIANCSVDRTSKHGIGRTDSSGGHTVNFDDCTVEQCSAYSSNSPFVDYNGNPAATGNVSNWNRCTNRYPSGVAGYVTPNYDVTGYPQTQSYLSHNNGSGTQYSSINFLSPVFGGGIAGGPTAAITVTGGNALTASFNAPATVQRCGFTGYAPALTAGGLLRNCLIFSTQAALYSAAYAPLKGNVQIIGNTFDFSNPNQVISGNSTYPLFIRSGALQFTFRNNLVITPTGQDFRLLKGAVNTDTLALARNAFKLGGSGNVLDAYNDGTTVADRTLAQTQALMLDTGSFATTDPKLDAEGFPALDSPLVDAGSNLGPLVDFTGRPFNARSTIGALEPRGTFARWQAQNFSPAQIAAGLAAPNADPDGDGRSNLLEYALVTSPVTADSGEAFSSGVSSVDGRLYLTLAYRQLEYTADLVYAPEAADILGQWQVGPNALTPISRVENGDGTATVTVRDTLELGAKPTRFLRLKVTTP